MTHLLRLSSYLDFTDSIDLYWKKHLFFYSSKNEKCFHANSEFVSKFVDNWVAIESQRIKQYYYFFKNESKKCFLFSTTHFKVFFWWPILALFLGAQFFRDLDLPPF